MAPRLPKTLLHVVVVQALTLTPCLGAAQTAAPTAGQAATPAQAAAVPAGPATQRAEKRTEMSERRKALIDLKNSVIEQPDNADLRYRLGALYLGTGDLDSAEKEVERSIELGRQDFAPRMLLIKVWMARGDYRKLLTDTSLSLAETPEDKAAVKVAQGSARLASKETDGARAAFEAALLDLPQYSPAYLGLARAKLAAGDRAGAELALREAAAGNAVDKVEVLTLRGDLARERGDYAESERIYQEAAREPNAPLQLLNSLATVQIEAGRLDDAVANLDLVLGVNPQDIHATYLKSLAALYRKDYTHAAELAESVVNQGVALPGPLLIAGTANYNLGFLQKAREYLSQYVALQPEEPRGRRVLGVTLLSAGAPRDAYPVLKPLVDATTKDAELLAALGTAASLSGRGAEGLGYLERAAALSPTDAQVAARLAAAKVAAGDRREGLTELQNLAAAHPGASALSFDLARNYIGYGEFAQAVAAARQFREAQPGQARAWTLEGLALLAQGDLAAAEASFHKAIEIDPEDLDAQTGLADVQFQRGDLAGATATLEAVLRKHPDHTKTIINLARLERVPGQGRQPTRRLMEALKTNPGDLDLRLALVDTYVQDLRLKDAQEVLDAVADPDDPRVLFARGGLELAGARAPAALATLTHLVAAQPQWTEARLLLARAYEQQGDWKRSRAELDAALAQAPAHLGARISAARVTLVGPAANAANAKASVEAVLALAQDYPQDPRVIMLRGLASMALGKKDAAVALLKTAHGAAKTTDTAYALAMALVSTQQMDAALAHLSGWLSEHPEDNLTRLSLARLQMGLGDNQGAAGNLAQARKAGAEVPDLNLALAWALVNTGRADEAAPLAQDALARMPDDAMARHTLGAVQLAKGKSAEALETLRSAMAVSPKPSPRLQLDYGKALLAVNKPKEARAAVTAALASPMDFPERKEAEALLRRLPN